MQKDFALFFAFAGVQPSIKRIQLSREPLLCVLSINLAQDSILLPNVTVT